MNVISKTRKAIHSAFAQTILVLLSVTPAQSQTPSPALLVLDKEDNMLSIIDPATLKTVARIGSRPARAPTKSSPPKTANWPLSPTTALALRATRYP